VEDQVQLEVIQYGDVLQPLEVELVVAVDVDQELLEELEVLVVEDKEIYVLKEVEEHLINPMVDFQIQ
jgi:hypothetical protein